MPDFFNILDHALFQFINDGLGNPVFDALLPLFREKLFWAPLYLFLLAFAVLNFGLRKRGTFLLCLALAVGTSDAVSSRLVKKNVERPRPCNEPGFRDSVRLRVPNCGSGFSFTSSHAANHFAAAVFVGGVLLAFGQWVRLVLLLWAGLIAFSQVYVGVHFPGDVVFGALLGATIGHLALHLFRKINWDERPMSA